MLISLYSIYYRHQDAVFTINISIQYISVYISIYQYILYYTVQYIWSNIHDNTSYLSAIPSHPLLSRSGWAHLCARRIAVWIDQGRARCVPGAEWLGHHCSFLWQCTGVIRSFFRWSFQNLMWVGFFLGLQHVSTMFNPSYPAHVAPSGTGAEGQRRAARSACCQGGARGSQTAAENGGKGGQTPNTVIFKTDKYRIAYCETNPGRCRYLSLLIPSAICLKDPAGFIALSFGRPSVFDWFRPSFLREHFEAYFVICSMFLVHIQPCGLIAKKCVLFKRVFKSSPLTW